jgi:octaprenyl-diphosphate synthase
MPQKITLPLIYALNKSGSAEKKRIINLVKNHNEESEKVSEIINFVRNSIFSQLNWIAILHVF